MKITGSIRKKLKEPLGRLIQEPELKKLKGRMKKSFVIAVGDVCGKRLEKSGINVNIWIYDGKVMRKPVKWKIDFPTHVVGNPSGNITPSLMRAVDNAIRKKYGRIFVKGEEDLASLYCIAVAPLKSFVVYGQPKKGIVVVEIDKENKKKAVSIIFKCR